MIIAQLSGGLGNQFYQYALARRLAYELKTELKIDKSRVRAFRGEKTQYHNYYRLGAFNIHEVFATPEEIERVRKTGTTPNSPQELENLQGDIYIQGNYAHDERFFASIIDIIRRDFTLKNPLSPNAEAWRQKILSAECSVSMHFRHGDFLKLVSGDIKINPWFNITPIVYYYTCLNILKHRYNTPPHLPTVFVFSDDMPWVKKNLHLDVPTEFVEYCATDDEEWILMSLCKHNIIASSTFSRTAASLNATPDKKIFAPIYTTAEVVQQFMNSLTPAKKDALFKKQVIGVPFDYYNQPKVTPVKSDSFLISNIGVPFGYYNQLR